MKMKKGTAIGLAAAVLILEGLFFLKVRHDRLAVSEPTEPPAESSAVSPVVPPEESEPLPSCMAPKEVL